MWIGTTGVLFYVNAEKGKIQKVTERPDGR